MINGIVIKGVRVVIPKQMQTEMLKKHHLSHMEIEKTKLRA